MKRCCAANTCRGCDKPCCNPNNATTEYVRMAIEVAKVELKTVQDASGVEDLIKAGKFTADQVIAVIGKTEGNGGVNDFTRILADQAFRRVLQKHGKRSESEIALIPMVWS